MGRININTSTIEVNNTLNNTTSTGKTNIVTFIDDSGNVLQLKKIEKKRYKYYIDPELPDRIVSNPCYIGISEPESGDCSYGVALGFGDRTTLLASY